MTDKAFNQIQALMNKAFDNLTINIKGTLETIVSKKCKITCGVSIAVALAVGVSIGFASRCNVTVVNTAVVLASEVADEAKATRTLTVAVEGKPILHLHSSTLDNQAKSDSDKPAADQGKAEKLEPAASPPTPDSKPTPEPCGIGFSHSSTNTQNT